MITHSVNDNVSAMHRDDTAQKYYLGPSSFGVMEERRLRSTSQPIRIVALRTPTPCCYELRWSACIIGATYEPDPAWVKLRAVLRARHIDCVRTHVLLGEGHTYICELLCTGNGRCCVARDVEETDVPGLAYAFGY